MLEQRVAGATTTAPPRTAWPRSTRASQPTVSVSPRPCVAAGPTRWSAGARSARRSWPPARSAPRSCRRHLRAAGLAAHRALRPRVARHRRRPGPDHDPARGRHGPARRRVAADATGPRAQGAVPRVAAVEPADHARAAALQPRRLQLRRAGPDRAARDGPVCRRPVLGARGPSPTRSTRCGCRRRRRTARWPSRSSTSSSASSPRTPTCRPSPCACRRCSRSGCSPTPSRASPSATASAVGTRSGSACSTRSS